MSIEVEDVGAAEDAPDLNVPNRAVDESKRPAARRAAPTGYPLLGSATRAHRVRSVDYATEGGSSSPERDPPDVARRPSRREATRLADAFEEQGGDT